ncbi:hypothetical protein C7212DRAFT_306427, partial [Tuber magnatum]
MRGGEEEEEEEEEEERRERKEWLEEGSNCEESARHVKGDSGTHTVRVPCQREGGEGRVKG